MDEQRVPSVECAAPMWEEQEARQCAAPMWEKAEVHFIQRPEQVVVNKPSLEQTCAAPMWEAEMHNVEETEGVPLLSVVRPKARRRKKQQAKQVKQVEVFNDWTADNLLTIDKFKTTIKNSSIVYGKRMERNDRNLQRVLVLSLIFSALLTLGSGIAVALGAITSVNTWIIFGFNIVLLAFSAISLIVGGLNQVYGWDNKVDKLAKFIEKLDSFWLLLDTETKLPVESRFNAKMFLARVTGKYTSLLNECENISKEEYDEAMASVVSNV